MGGNFEDGERRGVWDDGHEEAMRRVDCKGDVDLVAGEDLGRFVRRGREGEASIQEGEVGEGDGEGFYDEGEVGELLW